MPGVELARIGGVLPGAGETDRDRIAAAGKSPEASGTLFHGGMTTVMGRRLDTAELPSLLSSARAGHPVAALGRRVVGPVFAAPLNDSRIEASFALRLKPSAALDHDLFSGVCILQSVAESYSTTCRILPEKCCPYQYVTDRRSPKGSHPDRAPPESDRHSNSCLRLAAVGLPAQSIRYLCGKAHAVEGFQSELGHAQVLIHVQFSGQHLRGKEDNRDI